MHHHRRPVPSARANPEALHPLVTGNTYEWSTGRDVQLHHGKHAGHLFGHCHRPERLFQHLREEIIQQPAAAMHHCWRQHLCEGESSELCTPLVVGNTICGAPARRPTASQLTCRAFIPGHRHRPERLL